MRKLATLLLAAALLLTCTREKPLPPVQATTTATTTTAPPPGPRVGGRLIRRLESDVNTLNYVMQGTDDERQVLQYLYDPLIDFDENMEAIPGTVARWEIADAGKTYTLHLDPRATFSDGQPVTAADVLFTLTTIIDQQSPQFSAWFDGLDREKSKAVDEKTALIVFREARVTQLYAFNIGVLPMHVYSKGDFKKNKAVIGNGPYVLKKRETGRSILVERNPNYWREKPPIDSVLFRVINDDNVAWSALQRGDIHVTRVNNDAWFHVKDDPAVNARITFHNVYPLAYNAIPWNLKDPLFQDVRVRRALAMAFDRQAVIEKLYHGQARAISGPFPPDSWAYNTAVNAIELNPEAAKGLLASAGWSDSNGDGILDREGKPFSFTLLITAGSKTSVDQSQIYQDALRGIGVEMSIATLDGAAFFDRVLQGNYQAALMSWALDPDPDPYSLFHSSQKPPAGLNVVNFESPEVDRLLEQGRTEFDRSRRTETYHQLHEILAADQPTLWMVQVGMKWAVDRRVKNVRTAKGLGLFLWNPGPFAWWLIED
ncbi:MAG: ABC transporter substrate-binding protein [Acidobacteriota bacterium]